MTPIARRTASDHPCGRRRSTSSPNSSYKPSICPLPKVERPRHSSDQLSDQDLAPTSAFSAARRSNHKFARQRPDRSQIAIFCRPADAPIRARSQTALFGHWADQNPNANCSPTCGGRPIRPSHGERSCCSAKVSRDAIRGSELNNWRTISGQLHSWLRCSNTM